MHLPPLGRLSGAFLAWQCAHFLAFRRAHAVGLHVLPQWAADFTAMLDMGGPL